MKARIRRGPKAKSIAVLLCSPAALNLPKTSAATEWVDEDIDVVVRKKEEIAQVTCYNYQRYVFLFLRHFRFNVLRMYIEFKETVVIPQGNLPISTLLR